MFKSPDAPTEYVIRNHKLFTCVTDGVVITDTRDPRVINFIANRNYDVEYPTPRVKPKHFLSYYGKYEKKSFAKAMFEQAQMTFPNTLFKLSD